MPSDYTGRTVALVGHCGPDVFALRSALRGALPGAEVITVGDDNTLAGAEADLLLINRVLDGRFSVDSGLDMIAARAGAGAPVMLISNFEDAQEAAVRAGALPGFGKNELYSDAMRDRLRAAISPSE